MIESSKYLTILQDGEALTVLQDNIFHDLINQCDIIYHDGLALYVTSIEVVGDFKTIDTIADFLERGIDVKDSNHIILKEVK